MKIKRQIKIAVVALLVVLGWAFFQLVLPWLQRTLSDPELESQGARQNQVVNRLVLDVVEPPPHMTGSPGVTGIRRNTDRRHVA